MNKIYYKILTEFIIGGIFLSAISTIANNIDPGLAGLLVGIPTGLLLMYFIIDHDKTVNYTITHTISILILAITSVFFHYLYLIKKVPKNNTIIYSVIIWVILIYLKWKSNLNQYLKK